MTQEEFVSKMQKMFGIEIDITPFFTKFSDYLDMLCNTDIVPLEKIIKFLVDHESSLLTSFKNNNPIKDMLLFDGKYIRRDKESILDDEYFLNIFNKIKNKIIDDSTLPILIDIVNIIYIYGYENPKIDDMLLSNVYNEANKDNIHDVIVNAEEKSGLSLKYKSWFDRFGDKLLPYINDFDLLKERIEKLKDYINVNDLYDTCLKAIKYKENSEMPSQEDIDKINSMFDKYYEINNYLLIKLVETNECFFVHFVQSEEISYTYENGEVVEKTSKNDSEESKYNNNQNSFMLYEFLKLIKLKFKEETGQEFDNTNKEHVKYLEKKLEDYSNLRNNYPLSRIDIPLEEQYHFKRYARAASSRVSTSLIYINNPYPHLDRKVGLVLEPLEESAILSTSMGYTSQKDEPDFQNDGASFEEMVTYGVPYGTNEVAMDINKCKVSYVILLSDEPKYVKRAETLAESYHVDILKAGLESPVRN